MVPVRHVGDVKPVNTGRHWHRRARRESKQPETRDCDIRRLTQADRATWAETCATMSAQTPHQTPGQCLHRMPSMGGWWQCKAQPSREKTSELAHRPGRGRAPTRDERGTPSERTSLDLRAVHPCSLESTPLHLTSPALRLRAPGPFWRWRQAALARQCLSHACDRQEGTRSLPPLPQFGDQSVASHTYSRS